LKEGCFLNKLLTYIVTHDSGLAPNPFWNWCTLAVCTPNHQGARIEKGDWIVGFYNKKHGNKFLYAMEVYDRRIHLNDYFHDKQFAKKKPNINGSWKQRCGDNFYSLDKNGKWQQHETLHHNTQKSFEQDTRHPYVFVAKKFWYLGSNAYDLPKCFLPLVGGIGIRVNHDPILVEKFKKWITENFSEGCHGLPRDIEQSDCVRQV
jgi:hypothetical protein